MINPPVGTTVQDIWDAIKAGSLTHVRMKFDEDLMVEDQDIDINTGLVLTDMLNGDTDLTFGRAVSKQLSTTIMITNRTAYLPWIKEFELLMGVEINGSTVWTSMGFFSGTRPKNYTVKDKVEFTAYDRMTKFDLLADEFWSGLDFTTPLSLEDIYHALCTYCSVGYDSGDELSASFQRTYSAAPMDLTGYTCRDVLAWIAEAVGCYAKINASGNCQLVWFGDATSHVITRNEEFHIEHADLYSGMIWDEFDLYTWNEADVFTWDEVEGYYGATYGIRGVKIKQTNLGMDVDYPNTQPWNVYTIMDNPFLQIEDLVTDPVTYVKPIYDRLVALGGQLPMNADCIGCWCIEAGDIITIHVANEEIHLPVFCKTMKWNGATHDTYETTGEKFRKIINDSQKQRVINNRNIKLYVDGNCYGIVNGVEIDSDGVKITGSKYINIASGSSLKDFGDINIENGGKLDVKSGGDVDVESGGDVNIKSGGKLNIASGGDIEVASGGDINVKSGGNLNVNSGGNIDINGSGNLKLTGSTVEIKSGSTFDVDATNFKISSANKKVVAGNWQLDDTGLEYTSSNNIEPFCIRQGILWGSEKTGIYHEIGDIAGSTAKIGTLNFAIRFYSGSSYMTGHLYNRCMYNNSKKRLTTAPGDVDEWYVGNASVYTYITTDAVTAYNYYNRSSREIKHDIKRVEDVGRQIDSLIPVTFVYDRDKDERTRYGLIYEDTVEVIPEICTDNESDKAINYVELVPILLKEIQDLRARVKTLEERLGE